MGYVAEIKAAETSAGFTMALQMISPVGEQKATRGLLRIAIVLDSYNVSAWIASVIDDLLGTDFLDVAAVVFWPEDKPESNSSSGDWLFRKYAEWDAKSKRSDDHPLRTVNISARLAGIAPERVAEADALERLPGCDLDVLIWLASKPPEAALKRLARFGVWQYRHREPAHFWEIYETNPVTRSVLEVLHEESDAPQVIDEAHSATAQGWSWQQNQSVPYQRAATFMVRSLRRLQEGKSQGLQALSRPVQAVDEIARFERTPTNIQVAGFLFRNAARTVSRRIRYAHKESHWFVAYRTDRSKFVSNGEELDLHGFQEIRAPDGHFYADPFVIKWQGRNCLFVEDYPFAERKGCISVIEMRSDGTISEAERVLDLPYHLSYPFVLEHEGALYMIPETLGAGRIELYRAADVLGKWELVKVLKEDVRAVDTTLWMEDGRFYFFTNLSERGATVNDDLYLFYADDLLGEWTAHPGNPLVTDVRRSRGAGKLFWRNGKLIRPAQDCSVRYGYACQLNEVEVLSPTEYRERPVERIEPNWAPGLIGTHTINSNEDFELNAGQVYGKRYPAKE